MRIPEGDAVLSSTWLTRALEASPEWPHRSLDVVDATPIGMDYGLSGRIHRVVAKTERGGTRSLVVKQESAQAVERELLFRSYCGERLRGCIPDCLGGWSDAEAARGVLLLEDVAPAEQGDVLQGCTEAQEEAVVRVLARVHAVSWKPRDDAFPEALPRWAARPMEAERWMDRLTRARDRFPEVVTSEIAARVHDLPDAVAEAVDELRSGPASWIHVDAHLDNVLWRPDGRAVLLDWCNAAVGPPIADSTRCLGEGFDPGSRPERVAELLGSYADELERSEAPHVDRSELGVAVSLALLPLLQAAVEWAGRPEPPARGRPYALCESFLDSVVSWFA